MTVAEKLEELNQRLFGLEGRMTTFEKISESDREYRKEIHKAMLDNMAELRTDVRKIQLKLAWYAGALAVVMVVLKVVFKA